MLAVHRCHSVDSQVLRPLVLSPAQWAVAPESADKALHFLFFFTLFVPGSYS